jgi:hypothetical protein
MYPKPYSFAWRIPSRVLATDRLAGAETQQGGHHNQMHANMRMAITSPKKRNRMFAASAFCSVLQV